MSAQLNPAQQAAMTYLDGPLLVLAGAGSGKTRVITQKIAWLIESCGFSPNNIAAITFTNKAAKEMRQRIEKRLSNNRADAITIATFHALGLSILREEYRALGMKNRFSIFDFSDCLALCCDIFSFTDKAQIKQMLGQISLWKNAMISAEAAAKIADSEFLKQCALLYQQYETTLRSYQAVDLDDLIYLPVVLFEQHPELLDKWQNRLRYLLIDEYQDTNPCQYRLIRQLTGARAQFTAVGDDDQAIYGWRGADIDNLRRLPEDYPKLKVIKLEQNYRSTGRILKTANALIAHNQKLFEKKLWSELGMGEPVRLMQCKDNEHEAEYVTTQLLAHRFNNRTKFSDYAILYRSNHQAKYFEQSLRQHKVPYRISGGHSFFDKTEIKDLTAWLRILANPDDDPAFIRAATTPKRGLGSQTLSEVGAYAGMRHISLLAACQESGLQSRLAARPYAVLCELAEFIHRFSQRANHERPDALLPQLLSTIGYRDHLHLHEEQRIANARWANIEEFVAWLSEKGETEQISLNDVTQNMMLVNRLDKDESGDLLQLSTLHAAKGLEFKHVFLVGVEEGLLPHRESMETGQIEEERRLMYVGITRAERSLHVSYCMNRRHNRETIKCQISRFVAEMGEEVQNTQSIIPSKSETQSKLAAMKALLANKANTAKPS